ncbi:tyrosine kinase catalytic domain protein [Rhizoctonia solani 123E]|uniref:Tyrosine kinase catalytic domain protein n=1 Tax=Rhizoctonia solani 123E TaxID=1423351 RepID=A0A074RNM5_9AGAM|nr:tyrosine kinase catalytic domain protein [Rhizoctonia solani 123E]
MDSLDSSACSQHPSASGGYGDVYFGRLHDGTAVAIKTIRTYYQPGQQALVYHKQAAKEVYTWSKCKHPNVVQLTGLAVFRGCVAMVSRWEEHGNLLSYLSNHPSTDRCSLSVAICEGLVYLHGINIVHGDLKGANVLIAQDGTPMLADFGNASLDISNPTLGFTQNNTKPSFSLRWTAPEMFDEEGSPTMAGDIYSLGMTILETFTAEIPFVGKTDRWVMMHILHKEIPSRPEKVIPTRSIDGDTLWAILTKCWSYDPKDRPNARDVWDEVSIVWVDHRVHHLLNFSTCTSDEVDHVRQPEGN